MRERSEVRTTREKVYFSLIFLISFPLWFFILRAVWGDISYYTKLTDFSTTCFERDPATQRIVELERKLLFRGETCRTIEDVPEAARKEIESSAGIAAKNKSLFTFPLIFFGLVAFGFVGQLANLAYIRLNAIKISPNQFPKLYKSAGELSDKLGFRKQPDMFVLMGNGVLNAFAAKLVFRKILVIYSDLAEALLESKNPNQLKAVMAHELGHHWLGHTSWWMWGLEPGMFIPFLGSAYSRAREYSCDRVARMIVNDQISCERALVKLAAGRKLGEKANINAFVEQATDEAGFFSWFAEKLATHPHLAHRILAIRRWEGRFNTSAASRIPQVS